MNEDDQARGTLLISGLIMMVIIALRVVFMLKSCEPWHEGAKPEPCSCCPQGIPK